MRQNLGAEFTVSSPVLNHPVAVGSVGMPEGVEVKAHGIGSDGKKTMFLQIVCDALSLGFQHIPREPHSRDQEATQLQEFDLVLNRGGINFGLHQTKLSGLASIHFKLQDASARTRPQPVLRSGKKVAFLAKLALELHDGF